MREYSFQFSNLQAGISPSEVQLRNSSDLYDAYNVRAAKAGLTSLPSIRHIEPVLPYGWPFPQALNSSRGPLLAWPGIVGTFNTTTLVTTPISDANCYEHITLADFGQFMAFTTRSDVMHNGFLDGVDFGSAFMDYDPYSVCNFRGQLLMGGMGTGIYKNFVVWSNIGSADMYVLGSIRTGYGDWNNYFGLVVPPRSAAAPDKKLGAGNRHMEWGGQVYLVKPLYKGVVVYGERGVSVLIPATSPTPTFGLLNLPLSGIIGRFAVTGDLDRHWFIDLDGYIWTIGNDFIPQKLGYNRTFAGRTAMIGSFDQLLRDVYFGDSNECFLLSSRLTRLDRAPCSVARFGSTLFMFYPYGGS